MQSEGHLKMCTKSFFVFLLCIAVINSQDDYDYDYSNDSDDDFKQEMIKNEIEWTGLVLRDDCENKAIVLRSSLINNTFDEKIKVLKEYGQLIKTQVKKLKQFENDIPGELIRNWTLFMKPGDALLENDDWNNLVSYSVGTDQFIHTATVHCHNKTDDDCIFIKSGYEKLLESSRNITLLRKSWSAWQTLLTARQEGFSDVLNLVNKAASQNDQSDAETYWEMLTDLDGGYSVAEDIWERVKPLYSKLHSFVKKRVFHHYSINETENIPVYLLGSNFGDDWSYIADIVLPYPNIYYQAEASLKKKTPREYYKWAEEFTQELNLGALGQKFWDSSLFNLSFCENNIVSDCVNEYSQILTCDKVYWVSYLDSFENAIDITLRNLNYVALPQINLRYSAINEALKNLASIFAIKNMRYRGIWDQSGTTNSELLLIALRILPKLPYYLVGDKWRLDVLQKDGDSSDIEDKWWKLRNEYQGVSSVSNTEADYLGDSYIISNKPYLSKFLGIILTFQLLEHYQNDFQDSDENFIQNVAQDANFLTMLHQRSSVEWPSLISDHYAIYDLNPDSLLNYFSPLNDYLDQEPGATTTSTKPFILKSHEEPTTFASHDSFHNKTHKKSLHNLVNDGVSEGPLFPPVHEHVEENLEGPNPTMETISMYVGISLLVAVVAIIVFVIVSKKMKRRKRTNNRRLET